MWVEAILTWVISKGASFVTLQQVEEANFAGAYSGSLKLWI